MNKITVALAVSAALLLGAWAGSALGGTLDDVKARGHLQCGIAQNLAGFGYADAQGNYLGFDVDFCRGLAAAIGVSVKFTPLSAKERFPALQSGEVDVLYRNTTWTMNRDTKLGFDFAGVNYYDGQGFIVRKSLGVKSAKQLNGASICIQTGTTTELNVADYFRANNMKYKPVLYEKSDDARLAYEAGRCDSYTTDASGLAAHRGAMKDPKEHIILPEIISKEPLGPATRHGDNNWTDVVRWVLNAHVIAEEKGLTMANVKGMAGSSEDPDVQRLLGKNGSLWTDVGLKDDAALNAIAAVGNYGEIFERNVGVNTPLALERGQNALWSNGGLQYAPPAR